jgi:hypothetical protein
MTKSLSIRIDKNVAMPMRDGVILRGDVWRPNDSNSYPALVSRTPYQKERMVGNDFLPYDQAAAAGYAVVVQDTRGRFASDGEWEGFMWHREAPDTYDTVEWAAAQPWCNGNVGLWGISYLAAICWLGAMEHPPHLKAIAPAMVSDGPLGTIEVGGAFRLESLMNWFIFQLISDVLPKHIAAGTATPEMIAKLIGVFPDGRSMLVCEALEYASDPNLSDAEKLLKATSFGPDPKALLQPIFDFGDAIKEDQLTKQLVQLYAKNELGSATWVYETCAMINGKGTAGPARA